MVSERVLLIVVLLGLAAVPCRAQSCTPLPPDAVAWWTGDTSGFDDALGNVTTVGVLGVSLVPGRVGDGFLFDSSAPSGTGIDIAPSDLFLHGPSGFTVELWVLPDPSAAQVDFYSIIDNEHACLPARGWTLQEGSTDDTLSVTFAQIDGCNGETCPTPLSTATWQHHAAVWDPANDEILTYRNGVQCTTEIIGGAGAASVGGSALAIGYWIGGGSRDFIGKLDEITLYQRALDATEIQAIWQAGSAGKCPCEAVVDASETVRIGAPANPTALMPGLTSGPVIGATWDPWVDHAGFVPSAFLDVLFIWPGPTNIPTAAGTILCAGPSPPWPVTFLAFPGGSFNVQIPDLCILQGIDICTQALSIGVGSIQWTNALDVTLGF